MCVCVCVCVVCQHFQTSSPLKPLGRLKPNFIWSLLGTGERKFVQMIQVTWPRWPPCLYMVKKSSSPEPKARWPWNLLCSIRCSSTTKFIQMMTLGWPWPILWQGQIWSLMLLYGKTMDFSETIVVYDLKLAIDDRSDKRFLLTSKLCLLGAVCPMPRGHMHVLNHEKNCIKSDSKEISLKLATNG